MEPALSILCKTCMDLGADTLELWNMLEILFSINLGDKRNIEKLGKALQQIKHPDFVPHIKGIGKQVGQEKKFFLAHDGIC